MTEGSRQSGEARRDLIALELARHGYVSIAGLARRLGVSEMTIRRDFSHLERNGSLRRAHGGAVSRAVSSLDLLEPDVEERIGRNAVEKVRIGTHAARFVEPGHFIALDIGSTTLCLAHALKGQDVRYFTCSLKIATLLSAAGASVLSPGGKVQGSEPSFVGAMTRRQIESFRFDILFLSGSGISASGLYDYSHEDSEIKRALIEQANRVVALADHSKFGRLSVAKVCGLEALDVLVTDSAPGAELSAPLAEAGVPVDIAET